MFFGKPFGCFCACENCLFLLWLVHFFGKPFGCFHACENCLFVNPNPTLLGSHIIVVLMPRKT
jgi:hypothetical protein